LLHKEEYANVMINGKILRHCATIDALIAVAIVISLTLALAFAALVLSALVVLIVALD
jgi:hypothetical protein